MSNGFELAACEDGSREGWGEGVGIREIKKRERRVGGRARRRIDRQNANL
jgi:hypothetical protein